MGGEVGGGQRAADRGQLGGPGAARGIHCGGADERSEVCMRSSLRLSNTPASTARPAATDAGGRQGTEPHPGGHRHLGAQELPGDFGIGAVPVEEQALAAMSDGFAIADLGKGGAHVRRHVGRGPVPTRRQGQLVVIVGREQQARRALGDDPAVFSLLKRNMEQHRPPPCGYFSPERTTCQYTLIRCRRISRLSARPSREKRFSFRPSWLCRSANALTVGTIYPEQRHPVSLLLQRLYAPVLRVAMRATLRDAKGKAALRYKKVGSSNGQGHGKGKYPLPDALDPISNIPIPRIFPPDPAIGFQCLRCARKRFKSLP